MTTIKDQILDLITNKPKHYSKIVKHDANLREWVQKNSLVKSENFAEMIYSAIHQKTNICESGNTRKFSGFSTGFIGCGPANKCTCVAQTVSDSVKTSKAKTTDEQKSVTNQKRQKTNLEKYGVTNAAQTPENRQRFRDWYANPENVQSNLDRIRKTNLERYGVENCKSLPEVEEKIIATCLARYGVKNVAQIPSTKAKLRARTAEYKLSRHLLSHGYSKFSEYINANYNFSLITPFAEYAGVTGKTPLAFRCNSCGSEKTTKFYYGRGINCDTCNPTVPAFVSGEEQAVFDFITSELGVANGVQGDRTIIAPYELDMVFPDQRIAIEYCGLYWHSEFSSGKDKNYHAEKLKSASNAGYRLITIFSDEWNTRQNVVKSKLRNIFKKTSQKYYARKLVVRAVNGDDSKQFLNLHHLQGNSSAKINLGLYSDATLVALMTFSNGRAALNTKSAADEYELVRFVTDGSSVVGGASKLLAHFIKMYNPRKIVSYADLRWSEGNVYSTIGFKMLGAPTIGYWYVDSYQTRHHRYNFTKKQLVDAGHDPLLTEWEIMCELGYDRIWDCGHQKFVLEC